MKQAVMASITPRYCSLILSGQKTLEVRLTRPKQDPPFEVYIYCTKPKKLRLWRGASYIYADDHSHNAFDKDWSGHVVGKFICREIESFDVPYPAYQSELDKRILQESCLSYYQLHHYAYHDVLYGWHISDCIALDEPLGIESFRRPCINDLRCESCAMHSENLNICGNESLLVKRPPQSWFYVEERI